MMRFKKLPCIILLLLSLCTFNVRAQILDSLLKAFNAHNVADTLTINLLESLAYEYEDINPDTGIQFCDKAIDLAKKLNREEKLVTAYLLRGENNYLRNHYQESMSDIEKAYVLSGKSGNKQEIAATLNDLGRVNCYTRDYDKSIKYLKEALDLDKQLSNKEQTAKTFVNMGVYYSSLYNYTSAIEYFQKAADIYKKLNNKKEYARMVSSTGNSYRRTANFPAALANFHQALKIHEQLNNKPGIAYNYYSLGLLYAEISSLKAIEYFQMSLARYQKLDAKYYVANILNDIGSSYTAMADSGRIADYQQKSLANYASALKMNEQLNNQAGIALSLGNLAFDYICSADYLNAMKCLERALSINKELDEKFGIADNLETIALVYYTAPEKVLITLGINPADKYNKAIEKMKAAFLLFKEIGNIPRQTWELMRIQELYTNTSHYDSAYKYYKEFIILRDSAYNVEKQKAILSNELRYSFSKKEDSLQFNQQLTNEKLKQQTLISKQQEQALTLSNKEKDIQKLAYLEAQADLQNEQLEKKNQDKLLTISEKEKQLKDAQLKTFSQEKKLDKYKQQQQWIYIIAGLSLFSFISFYFINRVRVQKIRLRTEIAAERIEQHDKETLFQRQLADISLTALRSQMNPHFIFNCLNSIKLYTTQNDTIAASEYLTKFSKLIRLVMENSRNDKITLESELQALRLYIDMEVMRFKEKLSYSIKIDENVETDYIEIPPLLLQPYVENAIWHGLMHKEKGGKIDMTVAMQKDESLLEINIIDNGIGRAKSAELRSKTATKHKSYGMKVTSERIALINQIYKTGADVTVHDLNDDNGMASGTKVTIKIPV